ncbi:MAG: tetratricopeptide repeat protein [Myxococcales bacterium]|nr:tetratricopeptide repeat protein [Myxococcales bacterium]MCB9643604.1 tetratricopeptide repeat protein [Myxococcales bacterium]
MISGWMIWGRLMLDNPRFTRWCGGLLMLLSLVILGGCSPRNGEDERRWARHQQTQQNTRQLQEANLSMLSMARSHHRRASLYLQRNQVSKGLHELDAVLEMPFGTSFAAGQEAILDAWGRKASILLQLGRKDEAERVIEAALKLYAKAPASFYLAQLYHIQGRILEQNKKIEAALVAYQKSIEVNKAVIHRARARHLGGKPPQPATTQPSSPRSPR